MVSETKLDHLKLHIPRKNFDENFTDIPNVGRMETASPWVCDTFVSSCVGQQVHQQVWDILRGWNKGGRVSL